MYIIINKILQVQIQVQMQVVPNQQCIQTS